MKGLPIAVIAFIALTDAVTIKTNHGEITGEERLSRTGDKFTAFLGVPYAQPPVGELRWRPPKPLEDGWKWEGVRDGTKDEMECVQNYLMDPSQNVGSEDCLFVNVFTRHPGDADAKRPVLVWIHGGAFIFGGGTTYNPEYLMEEDVVIVVVQYRLNIFGFLSNEDKELPGNYGMKDQQEALRSVYFIFIMSILLILHKILEYNTGGCERTLVLMVVILKK